MKKKFGIVSSILITTIIMLYSGNLPCTATEAGEYTIGSDDVLNVSVLEEPTLTSTVTVGPDGKVVLPRPIGTIRADGLTHIQLEEAISEKLSNLIKNGVTVTVQIAQYNSRKVAVFGDGIRNPGIFSFSKIPAFLLILAKAGGLTTNADRKNISIISADDGKQTQFVDLEQLLKDTHPSWPKLVSGDTIWVPALPPPSPTTTKTTPQTNTTGTTQQTAPTGTTQQAGPLGTIQQTQPTGTGVLGTNQQAGGGIIIHVLGQVAQQGIYAFSAPPPLLSVLTQVGVSPQAKVKVIRTDGATQTVDMAKYIATGNPALLPAPLQSGDLVYVDSGDSGQQSVALLGAVTTPGNYLIEEPTNLLDLLVKAGGLATGADAGQILVTRETDDFIQTKTVNLQESSFEVRPGDKILIPNKIQQPQQQQSTLQRTTGAVRDVLLLYFLVTQGPRLRN